MANKASKKGVLVSEFEGRTIEDHARGWSHLWDAGRSNLWDRGQPSPALIDIIEEHQHNPEDIFYPFTQHGRRKKALVPGCGRGYDVIMLSLHGFDAYGLEISGTAVAEAQAYAATELSKPQAHNFGHEVQTDQTPGKGVAEFLQGDFFSSSWTKGDVKFDLIYDYTFMCALHPSRRVEWAERMAGLLNPGGILVCLEFPMYKDPSLLGPPWAVKGVHWRLLSSHGGSGKFTRKLYRQPARTHKIGMGTDMISMYVRDS